MNTKLYRPLGLLVLSTFASMCADAATVYKLVDRNGKVSYVQSHANDFDGKVISLEIDPNVNVMSAPPVPPKVLPVAGEPPKAQDYLSKRRSTRAALEARLATARQRLDDAKLALANLTMNEDDIHVILKVRQSVNGQASEGGPGSQSRNQLGCTQVVRNGRMVQACGAAAPNEKFVERATALEAEVKRAEEEVAEAEVAYRKGVD